MEKKKLLDQQSIFTKLAKHADKMMDETKKEKDTKNRLKKGHPKIASQIGAKNNLGSNCLSLHKTHPPPSSFWGKWASELLRQHLEVKELTFIFINRAIILYILIHYCVNPKSKLKLT